MINPKILRELVIRVRAECDTLGKRVGPAADYSNELLENTSIPAPNCTIIPLQEFGADKEISVPEQLIQQTYAFVVVVDNKPRRLNGQDLTPYDQLATIKNELDSALLNWIPTAQSKMIDELLFSRSFLLKETEGRIWWQYEYKTITYVRATSNINPCIFAEEDDYETCSILYQVVDDGYVDGTNPAEDYDVLINECEV